MHLWHSERTPLAHFGVVCVLVICVSVHSFVSFLFFFFAINFVLSFTWCLFTPCEKLFFLYFSRVQLGPFCAQFVWVVGFFLFFSFFVALSFFCPSMLECMQCSTHTHTHISLLQHAFEICFQWDKRRKKEKKINARNNLVHWGEKLRAWDSTNETTLQMKSCRTLNEKMGNGQRRVAMKILAGWFWGESENEDTEASTAPAEWETNRITGFHFTFNRARNDTTFMHFHDFQWCTDRSEQHFVFIKHKMIFVLNKNWSTFSVIVSHDEGTFFVMIDSKVSMFLLRFFLIEFIAVEWLKWLALHLRTVEWWRKSKQQNPNSKCATCKK